MNRVTENNNEPLTIQIVDDTLINLKLLVTCLEELNFKIIISEDGESALERAEFVIPDLILLDVVMPGMDGFEVCRRLKQNEKTRQIPVIFMTALSATIDKVKGFDIGAVDYITKPFQYEEVIVRIKTHLTIRYLQKQLEDSNKTLELQVSKRTSALSTANKALQAEVLKHKQTEKQLIDSLEEKGLLLQEVHHRVKNNFQIIISLLNLQLENDSPTENQKLEDAINRIRLLGDIHRKLYQQTDVTKIDFKQHLQENVQELIRNYNVDEKSIDFKLEISNPFFRLDQAISCGLLMNEIITSSLKQTFVGKRTIRISIKHNTDGELDEITYIDSCPPTSKGVKSIDTTIIDALSEQLGLFVNISNTGATQYDFRKKINCQDSKKPCGEILYIEDEIIIAMDKISSLKSDGYSVNENIITSGEAAVSYIHELDDKPGLILMDIKLSGEIDGIEAARQIREQCPSIPIVFFSGYEDSKTQKEIKAFPDADYLHKTCTSEEMTEKIDKYLKSN